MAMQGGAQGGQLVATFQSLEALGGAAVRMEMSQHEMSEPHEDDDDMIIDRRLGSTADRSHHEISAYLPLAPFRDWADFDGHSQSPRYRLAKKRAAAQINHQWSGVLF